MSVAARLAQRMRAETGTTADGIWSAPGRVNLIGEHTDYNGGFVLPFAIDRRTTVAAHRIDAPRLEVCSLATKDRVRIDLADLDAAIDGRSTAPALTLPPWSYYPLGVAWAMLGEIGAQPRDLPGVRLLIESDVPIGAGLSSSAALESAVGAALNDIWSAGLDPMALARIGHTAENDAVGAPTGMMDQVAVVLGKGEHATLLDCRDLTTEAIPLGLDAAGLTVLVIDSRIHHAHAEGGYRSRRAGCAAAAVALGVESLREVSPEDLAGAADHLDPTALRWVRHVVTENQRVLDTADLLRTASPGAIGPALVASHASMRDDFAITVHEIDLAVDAALDAGAVGARMTGGGFGGSAIALTPLDRVAAVTEAVTAALRAAGLTVPDIFAVTPSPGARRDQ